MTNTKRSLTERLWEQVPQISLPKLGRTVDIPVYIVHNSSDPEDYFFIFDFEEFVDGSRDGMFVRPKLKAWAGRSDFNRKRFGRQFRESFTVEFDAARSALTNQSRGSWGWLNWTIWNTGDLEDGFAIALVVNVILFLAFAGPKALLSVLPVPKVLRGKSKEAKLEESISQTQERVDQALSAMEITLHQELWGHAYSATAPGSRAGMDKDAWPLPQDVRAHLAGSTKTSTSWW